MKMTVSYLLSTDGSIKKWCELYGITPVNILNTDKPMIYFYIKDDVLYSCLSNWSEDTNDISVDFANSRLRSWQELGYRDQQDWEENGTCYFYEDVPAIA